ncbi:TetR/AcrR family transcriptional regulator [Agromyces sp. NPDC004153]
MTPRGYDSALRRGQAAETRRRVIRAALELFARDGYGATSIARIAEAAGVSVETVRTVGPKRRLLEEATVLATFGEDMHADVLDIDRDGARMGVDVTDAAGWLRTMSDIIARLNVEAAGIFRAFASAAADDPDIAAAWAAQQRTVRANWGGFVAWLDGKGWITSDTDRDDLATSAWLLTLADSYSRISASGVDDERYRHWLEASLRDLLFPGMGRA